MRWAGVLLILVAGCSTTRVGELPGSMRDQPGHDPGLRDRLQAARDQLARDEVAAALRTVEEIRGAHPEDVNTQRLRQDLLRQRGRLGLALHEAEARVAAHPDSAAAHYLLGRLQETTAAKRAAFERAIAADRSSFWGWFGLAFTLRSTDAPKATELYAALYARSRKLPHIGEAYAQALRQIGRFNEAVRVYGEIGAENRGLGVVGTAATLLNSGNRQKAWPHLLEGLRHRPYDRTLHGMIGGLLERGMAADQVDELVDVLRADPGRDRVLARRAPDLLAELHRRNGDPDRALSVLREARRRGPTLRRRYRRLLLQTGQVAAFLADLAAAAPAAVLTDEGNEVGGRWRALLTGPWMQAEDPLAAVPQATELVAALVRVGLLRHAEVLSGQLLRRHPRPADGADSADRLLALQDEIRREIAFEAAVRRRIEAGYAAFAHRRQTAALDAILADLRKVSQEILGRDVVGEPKLFEVPFVGTLIDSLGPGLPAHFARYNKHLVLGQRNARPTEGMILTRLSVRRVDPDPDIPLPPRTVEVIGEHRELQPLDQGDLAGIALLNHYVIDMDEVRSWADGLRDRRRVAGEDGGVLLRDPLPTQADPIAPAGAEWRLTLLSPVQDTELQSAVLDIIRRHEQGHMVDFLHFLPVGLHPLRALALTFRNGLSAVAVAAEMEARAELVALATSRHTRLVAAHIAGFLAGDSGDSPHARGFRRLVEELIDELGRRGVPDAAVRYWHRVDPHILRAAARQLLRRLW